MRRAGGGVGLLMGALALLVVVAFPGCENPFSPVDKSEKIQGLTYIDFSLTWERWDTDPEYDGVLVKISYYNEFNSTLAFHDKPHNVEIEFWSQKEVSGTDDPTKVFQVPDELFYSTTVEHSNSDDDIRIPIEAYSSALNGASGFDKNTDYIAYVLVRIYPPQEDPKPSLEAAYIDMNIYRPPVVLTP